MNPCASILFGSAASTRLKCSAACGIRPLAPYAFAINNCVATGASDGSSRVNCSNTPIASSYCRALNNACPRKYRAGGYRSAAMRKWGSASSYRPAASNSVPTS